MTKENVTKKAEAGFSLLELLLVVGVGALLLLAGIATYRQVVEDNKVNEAARILMIIKSETQRAYQGQPDYGAADITAVLADMEAYPAGVLDAAGAPKHPWGGDITVVGAGATFEITLAGLDKATCIELGSSLSADNDSDFDSMTIGGTAVADTSPVTLAAACDDGVDMVWAFF